MPGSRVILAAAVVAVSVYGVEQQDGMFDRIVNVSGPVNLDVTTDSGGIVVMPGPAGSVRIHGILKAQRGFFTAGNIEEHIRELERNPPIQQSGNTVRIGYVTDRSLLKGVSMRLEITAPPDTQVRARADSGGIRIEGIRGPVDLHTDSGGIHVSNIQSEVRAAADSGGIHIREVRGAVYARADSGGIDALEIAGAIDAQTDSGGLRLSQTTPATIRARADSGGATVTLSPAAGYDVRASSGSGRIVVPEMTVHGAFSKHKVEGKVRAGGPVVDIAVDSGNIDIR
jgi:hypothetical protein